uniref:Uncharacterized protein n=2 Tax=Anguilla anguilla TaxID=7936 RepID=A0A0E9PAQ1_ANGAN
MAWLQLRMVTPLSAGTVATVGVFSIVIKVNNSACLLLVLL